MDALAHAAILITAVAAVTVLAALGKIDGAVAASIVGAVAAERATVTASRLRRQPPGSI